MCLGLRPRHCNPSLQAQSEAQAAKAAAVAAEAAESAAAVLAEKDRKLEEVKAEAAQAAIEAKSSGEADAAKLAESGRLLAETRATVELLETEVRSVACLPLCEALQLVCTCACVRRLRRCSYALTIEGTPLQPILNRLQICTVRVDLCIYNTTGSHFWT